MGSKSRQLNPPKSKLVQLKKELSSTQEILRRTALFAQLLAFNFETIMELQERSNPGSKEKLNEIKRELLLDTSFGAIPRLELEEILNHPYNFSPEEQKILATKLGRPDWHPVIDDFFKKKEGANDSSDTPASDG